MDKITEIQLRIERNKMAKATILSRLLESGAPQGYSTGTSYLDADCIHGTKRTYDLVELVDRLRELDNFIYLDEIILENYLKEDRVNKTLKELTTTKDKVHYLRKVEGYSQEKTSEILRITDRHVRRLEQDF